MADDDPYAIPGDPEAPTGTIRAVSIEGIAHVTIRHVEGWVLVEDRCPHAHCPFSANAEVAPEAPILICNCHGSEFDLLTGAVLLPPAERGLEVTSLTACDGVLRVVEE